MTEQKPKLTLLMRVFFVSRFVSLAGTLLFMAVMSLPDSLVVATEGLPLAINVSLLLADVSLIVLVVRRSSYIAQLGALYMGVTLVYDAWRINRAVAANSPSTLIYGFALLWSGFWIWYFLSRQALWEPSG